MKKAEKIQDLLQSLPEAGGSGSMDPHYTGYFVCFNEQRYYEAHDILEHLWLQTRDGNYAFYKGLIQFAGAFVHLQKQRLRPLHPTDGRRARPASRLFLLAASNLQPYRPLHMRLDVAAVCELCTGLAAEIASQGYESNPWSPESAPMLRLALEA